MKKRGKGIGTMFYPIGSTGKPNPASAFLKVNHDGSVTAFVGMVDKGQGATTALSQIIAEVLQISFKSIRMVTADTETTPYDHGTGASRVTYVAGNAVKKAAEVAKQMLLESAAIKLGLANAENLKLEAGKVIFDGYPTVAMTVEEAAWHSERKLGKPIIVAESYTPALTGLDPETGQGKPFETHIYATQIAEVEVDTETGEVDVLKIVAVHDCGRVLNPIMVEGQVEGGVVMGQGYALMEEILEDKVQGGVLNNSFVDYAIPTAMDAPGEIIVDFIEEPEEKGPFGAKGISEPTQLPTAPAIINAIYDAIGVRIYDLPATPDKILKALAEQSKKQEEM
ncbi:MAG: nicotinate dehydrogenase medium molybdopterin subunit [Firmicutes bacterium]|nr:nicotinate dehydrogenase medium molybdopterin subunit [Bacillota bacterium]